MTPKYKETLAEVDYMINGLEVQEKNKIPIKLLDFVKKNKANWYDYSKIDIENLSKETYAILSFIYRKFLASDEEKKTLEVEHLRKLTEEKEKEDQNIPEKQEINYGFATVTSYKPKDEVTIIPYEEKKWYTKLLEKITKK